MGAIETILGPLVAARATLGIFGSGFILVKCRKVGKVDLFVLTINLDSR